VLSVPAVGLGLATAELCGAALSEAELCGGDAAAADDTVATEVAGSRVSVITPDPEVQLASRTPAIASAAVIAADLRLNMKLPVTRPTPCVITVVSNVDDSSLGPKEST